MRYHWQVSIYFSSHNTSVSVWTMKKSESFMLFTDHFSLPFSLQKCLAGLSFMLLKRVPLFLRILRSVRIILFLRAPRCSCLHLLHQVDGCWTTLFLQPPVCISTISCWVCRIMTRTVTKILHFYILQVEGRKHLIIIDVLPHAKILWLHNEP